MKKEFIKAMIADGWEYDPELVHRVNAKTPQHWLQLQKEGWNACIFEVNEEGTFTRSSVWGPDKLQIVIPEEYSMEAFIAALRTCMYCKATDVDTQRVSFAGRCCEKCLPKKRKELEYPGWCS